MFSTVYLGHHYVIDLLAGAAYALVVFLTVYLWAVRFTAAHAIFSRRPQIVSAAQPLAQPDVGK
jgi:membrane-associated phospholipid phosphatase